MKTTDRANAIRLFFFGFLTLFLELVLIRYLAGNIWNLGYFPNLVLLGVFVGMGVGFLFHHRVSEASSVRLYRVAAYVLLALITFVTFAHPPMPLFTSGSGDLSGDLYFTMAKQRAPVVSEIFFVFWFVAIISVFFLIAQQAAKVFRLFAPLKAYTLDIAGSCCGILAFMTMSFFRLPGYVWFAVLIPIFLMALGEASRRHRLAVGLSLACIVGLARYQDSRLLASYDRGMALPDNVEVRWSPYQKVEYFNTPEMRHRVHVNGIGHQQMETAEFIKSSFYQLPYDARAKHPELPPFKNVLVVGAGSGNDVAAALANGAEHVDAVEIDPVIADLGIAHHPAHPYQDPRVTLTVDDGRAFMVRTKLKYDLVIYALTDSLVKVSPMAQLRLENYLFTEQSVHHAFDILNPGGEILFYNFYRRDWLVEKLERLFLNATGTAPHRLMKRDDFAMLAVDKIPQPAGAGAQIAQVDSPTDDWPFLYLKERGIPQIYRVAVAGLAGLVLLMLLFLQSSEEKSASQAGGKTSLPTKLSFLFMGIAFMLLETKSVIQFSLLFGTTWFNNSLVFLAVLVSVLLANWAATAIKSTRVWPIYLVLLASCLLTLVYPLGNLLTVENPFFRFILASLMTFSPIFFANLIFSLLFRDQKTAEHVFGWNLIGATLGGVVEYGSMVTGYNALAVIVAVCYALVFIFCLLDRARAPEPIELGQLSSSKT